MTRADQHFTGTEHDQVVAFVEDTRDEVVALLDGLTEEQARARLVPSATTLLGLVKHAVFVERVWFGEAVEGRSRSDLGIPVTPDESFELEEADTIASVLARYAAARADSTAAVAGLRLDDLVLHNRRGPLALRWVYLHLVRELSRHAGHGDILREQLLAD